MTLGAREANRPTRRRMINPSSLSGLSLRASCLCALALLVVLGFGVSTACALGSAPEEEKFIPSFDERGSGAGHSGLPVGIGTDPTTGDVYISDWETERVDEFSPWGNFIRAFGGGVADGTSKEPLTCTTTCFRGLPGSGAGEFDTPWGIAVAPNGNVYVRDYRNKRVQEFSSTGQFLLMFGGGVDETDVHKREEQEAKAEPVTVTAEEEDVCTAASGDQCGPGVEGSGHGQMNAGEDVAVGPEGMILVPDKERIEEFQPDGAYTSEVKIPGKTVARLAVDPQSGDPYVVYGTGGAKEESISELSQTGAALKVIKVTRPEAIATDSSGDLYVVSGQAESHKEQILEFNREGTQIADFDEGVGLGSPAETKIYGIGANTIGDLYVSNVRSGQIAFVSAYGPPPVNFEPPPAVPPTIESEYTLSSDLDSAVVQAQINPHFWAGATYYVQYGTGNCEVSACVAQPAAPGTKLTNSIVSEPVASQGVFLSGLQADTTYHYRFVTESGGGGPVFGPDRTFTTYPESALNVDCPNQALRTGFAAPLADCRAYEMVSPIDKDGGDILNLATLLEVKNGLNQSSTDGEGFTYSSDRAFADSKAGSYVNQYLARRDPATGWSTEAISPPQRPGPGVDDQDFVTLYDFFSADLSSGWLTPLSEPALAPGAVEGDYSLYRRDNGSGGYQTLATTGAGDLWPELQGVSTDGDLSVFRGIGQLTPESSSEPGIEQVYEADRNGALRLVSVLPDGLALNQSSSVGASNTSAYHGRFASVSHAVSDDGSRVYWSETNGGGYIGKLYLRENADQEQSAIAGKECSEPGKACTVLVSNNKASQFWTASPDGSKALYTAQEAEGASTGVLEEFNVEEDSSVPIAKKVEGVVGAGEDLSYIYFVSTEALAHGAKAGQPNLYVSHEGEIGLVATLSEADTSNEMSLIARYPILHAARVTPDGRHVAFISTASLTGYDNDDSVTGKPDYELYTYDAESKMLSCVSCDRSGARPTGRELTPSGANHVVSIAAAIPGWENQLYASHVLSDNGDRVFFESYTPLVTRDTNGKEDVYEWEALGSGDCGTQNTAFSEANGGCVSLISSGESPEDSEFLDASPNGNDAFFVTAASLLPQDPGSVDVYDARVDGGFSAPAAPPASCEGEACQGAPVSPNGQTPASLTFSGPGDLVSTPVGVATPKKATVPKKTTSQLRAAARLKALKACKAKGSIKRQRSCEAAVRKRYGAGTKSNGKKSNKGRGK
jgi:hypothetical protein